MKNASKKVIKKIGVWQWVVRVDDVIDEARFHHNLGWRMFTIGIFKFHTLPVEGQSFLPMYQRKFLYIGSDKDLYTGFVIRFAVWLPFERG